MGETKHDACCAMRFASFNSFPPTQMNTILFQGDWNIFKGKLKQAWAMLTGDDLEYEEGKTEVFFGRILKKTGEKRAAIERTKRECQELRQQLGWC